MVDPTLLCKIDSDLLIWNVLRNVAAHTSNGAHWKRRKKAVIDKVSVSLIKRYCIKVLEKRQ